MAAPTHMPRTTHSLRPKMDVLRESLSLSKAGDVIGEGVDSGGVGVKKKKKGKEIYGGGKTGVWVWDFICCFVR